VKPDGQFDEDYQCLYQPGLIKKESRPFIKDSADGVIITKNNGDKTAVPVEAKARVSPNTYHRTVARFNRVHKIVDMPGIGSNVKGVQTHDLDESAKAQNRWKHSA